MFYQCLGRPTINPLFIDPRRPSINQFFFLLLMLSLQWLNLYIYIYIFIFEDIIFVEPFETNLIRRLFLACNCSHAEVDVAFDKGCNINSAKTLPHEFLYQDASNCSPADNSFASSAVMPSLPMTIKWLRDCVKENPSLRLQVRLSLTQ